MTSNQPGHRRSEFAQYLGRHMEAWPGFTGSHPFKWTNWTEGIYQDYRILARKAVRADSVALHEHANHILSSQVFALTSSCHSGKAKWSGYPNVSATSLGKS